MRGEDLRVGVAIPAGGSGTRMGGSRRKQYLELAGVPVLLRAIRPFLEHPQVRSIVVALPGEDAASPPEWLRERLSEGEGGPRSRGGKARGPQLSVVSGGASRGASVRAALEALPESLDVIVIHDGARPLVNTAMIDRCLEVAAGGEGAVAGSPAVDTIKEVEGRRVVRTPDRSTLWHAQTPQAFPRTMILDAYRSASEAVAAAATDDSDLVARSGGTIVMVEGSTRNVKITRPEDLAVAEAFLRLEGDRHDRGEPSA